jgi:integrase
MGVKIREKPTGSGVWWVFVNHNGKRRSKRAGCESAAIEAADKIQARLVLNEFDMGKKKQLAPTFKVLSGLWLSLPHDQKESTIDSYRLNLERHVYPTLSNRRVDEIKRKDLKTLVDGLLLKGLSHSTVHIIRAVISLVLNYAVEIELIERNPLRDLVSKQVRKNDLPIEPLTEEEIGVLLAAASNYMGGAYYPATLTLLMTGMRIGELEALQWGDIDFHGRFIEVRRSMRYDQITDTKNRLRRRVDMTPMLADTLQALRVRHVKDALKAGRPAPEWVFAGRRGEMFNRTTFRNALHECLKTAKLRQIRIHDLRHTYATVRLMRSHNPGDVSYQLGHSSIKITYDVYGHWIPGKFKREVDDLDSLGRTHLAAPQAHPRVIGNDKAL